MPWKKRLVSWPGLISIMFLSGIIFLWRPVRAESAPTVAMNLMEYAVASNSAQVDSKSFTLAADSVESIYRITCFVSAVFRDGGYVSITDSDGREITGFPAWYQLPFR